MRALLDGLKALGRADDTIVVLLSDHGENLYDEPGRGMGHGDHLEGDKSMRVPVLIRDPIHRFPPHSVSGLTRDIDLVPTLLGLLGQKADPQMLSQLDGVDLLPLLRGTKGIAGSFCAFGNRAVVYTDRPWFCDRPAAALSGCDFNNRHQSGR